MCSHPFSGRSPPNRTAETTTICARYQDDDYTFDGNYQKADAVAWVTIGNWLEEDEDSTYFEASVNECYKGELPETIILRQSGSSQCTYQQYPLYTYGNQLFLFLYQDASESAYSQTFYQSPYDKQTILDIVTDDEGTAYLLDRCSFITESLSGKVRNLGLVDQDLQNTLQTKLTEEDSIWKTESRTYNDILKLDDVKSYILSAEWDTSEV